MSTIESRTTSIRVSGAETALAARGPHFFFVLAALFSAAVLAEWVIAERLGWTAAVPPTMWHAHEMVYGFAAAGLAGIVIAWVPRWARARQVSTSRLTLLLGIWLLGRAAMAVGGLLPPWLPAALDLSFLPGLAALVVVPHIAGRPERTLPLLALLAALWLGNLAMHAEVFGGTFAAAERGARIGIDAYLLLIAIVCGYAIPDATNRYLAARGAKARVRPAWLLDNLAIITLMLYAVSDAIAGTSHATSAAGLTAGIVNAVRLACWRGDRVLTAPAAAILHVGYLWLVVGLLLEGAVPLTNGVADMAAVHALSAGAIGTMLLAAIAHESMVHGGASGRGEAAVLAAYGLVSVAVVLRIAALFVPGAFVELIIASGAVWSLGFLCLLASYVTPILVSFGARRVTD